MDIRRYNSAAWDRQVAQGNPWTQPVGQRGSPLPGAGSGRLC